jgi:hypothetical protein
VVGVDLYGLMLELEEQVVLVEVETQEVHLVLYVELMEQQTLVEVVVEAQHLTVVLHQQVVKV